MANGWNDRARDKTKRRRVREWLKRLGRVKTWQLLLILLIFVLLTAIFLRLNNLNAVDLQTALKQADKTGDLAKIDTAAKNLQHYVAHHMNTSLPATPLQTLYDQAAQAAIDSAKPPEIDGSKYQQATDACMPQLRNYGYRAWANCVAQAVGVSNVTSLDTKVSEPDPSAYYIQYAPVRWSFDAAGISLLICLILMFAIILRLVASVILRIIVKFKYRAA